MGGDGQVGGDAFQVAQDVQMDVAGLERGDRALFQAFEMAFDRSLLELSQPAFSDINCLARVASRVLNTPTASRMTSRPALAMANSARPCGVRRAFLWMSIRSSLETDASATSASSLGAEWTTY